MAVIIANRLKAVGRGVATKKNLRQRNCQLLTRPLAYARSGALQALGIFSSAVDTVNKALSLLATVRRDFQMAYRAMLWQAC